MRPVLLCALGAILVTILLPPDALKGASSGMLAFVGLLVAMLIPTMALNVTALRPRRGRKDSERTGQALLEQFDYWAAMLWLSLTLAGLLILGGVLGWRAAEVSVTTPVGDFQLRAIAIVSVAAWFTTGLLAVKLGGFVRGFRSLLKLHISQVLDEVQSSDLSGDAKRQEAIQSKSTDPGFGKLID